MAIDRRTMLGATVAAAAAPIVPAAAERRPRRSFPDHFLWGAATAGHQVEGNNVNSDCWTLETVKPTVYAEPSGDADNSFELWPRDLDLVKAIGLNSYRFSLEWSRIEPEPGMFSIAMLDHYKAMIAGCRARGIVPIVTFNHYTTPRWFAARGGWTSSDSPALFGRFCDRAARRLVDAIGYATTLNEPNIIELIQHVLPPQVLAGLRPVIDQMTRAAARASGSELFVPGNAIVVPDPDAFTANLIAAHKAGRAAIKAARSTVPVGVSLAIPDDEPIGDPALRDAIRSKTYGPWLEAARADDFVGVQNYERVLWNATGKVDPPAGGERNAAGGEVYPASLANAVRYAYSVARVPVIVTEHGVNSSDDAVRARLIPAALAELRKAMDDGIPVKGYLHWSLLDNFEWIYGYKYHYGLVAVDRASFARTPKPSAAVLGAIARANALS